MGIAQDDITGDGTTSVILYIGELMKQAEWYLTEGIHPRALVEGWEVSKKVVLELLEFFKIPVDVANREILKCVARTSLRTKIIENIADQLAEIVVDAVLSISKGERNLIDLCMVEILNIKQKL